MASGRFPENWTALVADYNSRDYILEFRVGGLFWFLRGLMGPEACLRAFYDDPQLVRDMIDCFGACALWVADVGTRDVTPWRSVHATMETGGIDKRAIAHSKQVIDEHFHALVPAMLQSGGYIPHVDHGVASDLPFGNDAHYRDLLREISEGA